MRQLLRSLLIASISIIASVPIPAFAQGAVGEVTKVTGTAKLERAGKEMDVVAAMPVEIHDKLRTAAKAQLTMQFRDGSKLELSESGSFTIDQYTIDPSKSVAASIGLWANHLRAIVNVGLGGAPNFEVRTPNAVAAVRGTEFETAYIADRPCPEDRSCMRYTTVEVFKGLVNVANTADPAATVQVNEGYETTVACESPATPPAPLGMGEMGSPGYH
ncbi:MAG: FecR family protein [Candidatus Binatus sp.]|uniref:FecR family protein n=1 Tax=Candidatus Binatus sp. TaxID=2811406 RepID=UPI002722EFBD|nr:FecR family protein [Candidatus Binatus sp.]MDO8433136.1 FecR family protein [Candidatus Binatus sp.]